MKKQIVQFSNFSTHDILSMSPLERKNYLQTIQKLVTEEQTQHGCAVLSQKEMQRILLSKYELSRRSVSIALDVIYGD